MSTESTRKLFDGFFWIEPTRPSLQSPFNRTRVVWHYPTDVTSITKEFKDIPQFCFPDLEKVKLERPESSKSEHFAFTLTDSNGSRVYGICFRNLFRGENRRYDVGRRYKHCLCFISKFPYFGLFKVVLEQIHGMALLDDKLTNCVNFLEAMYNNTASAVLTIPRSVVTCLQYDFQMTLPTSFNNTNNNIINNINNSIPISDVPLLPLLELFGPEKLLLLLGAVMLERRLLFVSDSVDTLTSTIFAVASMISPFQWQHIFIPLLPSKLLTYVSAPMPYLIGIQRYNYSSIENTNSGVLGDILLIDCDVGDITSYGNNNNSNYSGSNTNDVNGNAGIPVNVPSIIDFIGDSGTSFNTFGDSLDRVKLKASGLAKQYFNISSFEVGAVNSASVAPSNAANIGPKDIVANLLSELRSMLSSKPTSNSIVNMTTNLLRNLPTVMGKYNNVTIEENKLQWQVETEKALRNSFVIFFAYCFAGLDESIRPNANLNPRRGANKKLSKEGGDAANGDGRSQFDVAGYLFSRSSKYNDSKALSNFITNFTQSQMFETYCEQRLSAILAKAPADDLALVDSNMYPLTIAYLKKQNLSITIANVKQAVMYNNNLFSLNNNTSYSSLEGSDGNANNDKFLLGANFHRLTVAMTGGECNAKSRTSEKTDSFPNESRSAANATANINPANLSLNQALDLICTDTYTTSQFNSIFSTIFYRLCTGKASLGRGSGGSATKRTFILLRHLLLNGSEACVTAALEYLPLIRYFLSLSNVMNAPPVQQAAANANNNILDYISHGAFVDLRPYCITILYLLIDHKKLRRQRSYAIFQVFGALSYLGNNNDGPVISSQGLPYLVDTAGKGRGGGKAFPDFASFHVFCQPPGQSANLAVLRTILRAVGDDDEEGNDRKYSVATASTEVNDEAIAKLQNKNLISIDSDEDEPKPGENVGQKSTAENSAAEIARQFDPFAHPDPFSGHTSPKDTNITNNAGINKMKSNSALLPPPPPLPAKGKKPQRQGAATATMSSETLSAVATRNTDSSLINFDSPIQTTKKTTSGFDQFPPGEEKYRIVNKDTGEVLDIRLLEECFLGTKTNAFSNSNTTTGGSYSYNNNNINNSNNNINNNNSYNSNNYKSSATDFGNIPVNRNLLNTLPRERQNSYKELTLPWNSHLPSNQSRVANNPSNSFDMTSNSPYKKQAAPVDPFANLINFKK